MVSKANLTQQVKMSLKLESITVQRKETTSTKSTMKSLSSRRTSSCNFSSFSIANRTFSAISLMLKQITTGHVNFSVTKLDLNSCDVIRFNIFITSYLSTSCRNLSPNQSSMSLYVESAFPWIEVDNEKNFMRQRETFLGFCNAARYDWLKVTFSTNEE